MNTSSSVQFNCSAIGVPQPRISWLRNGTVLLSSSRITIKIISNNSDIFAIQEVYSTVNLTNIRLQDRGNYTCRADNSFGAVATLHTDYTLLANDSELLCIPIDYIHVPFHCSPATNILC